MDAIHVVGAGGIGCAVGYALRAAGVAVAFVDANPAKVEAGRRDGVRVDDSPPLPAAFVHFDDWEASPGVPVLLCTKCYDNAAVLAKLPAGIELMPIQNGFDPRLLAFGHRWEGVASFVSECAPDRPHTRITRKGDLHLGGRGEGDPNASCSPPTRRPTEPGGDLPLTGSVVRSTTRTKGEGQDFTSPLEGEVDRTAHAVRAGGGWRPHGLFARALRTSRIFRVVTVPDISPVKHTKLMYNAAISPLAAAAGIDNGQLLSVPAARKLFFALLQENHRILTAAGVELGKVGPFHPSTVAWILRRRWLAAVMAKFFEPSLRGTYCSMAGEIQKGRTELENYNGHLLALAERHGTPCPLNRAVYELVSKMTTGRETPRRDVLDRLAARCA